MTVIAEAWLSLDDGTRLVLIGLVVSGAGFLVRRWWPRWEWVPDEAKRVLIALSAGLLTFASTGSWGAAIGSALAAFGAYHLATRKR